MMNTEFEKFEKSLVVTRYTSTACNEDLLNEFIHDITLKKEPQMIISTINNHLNNSLSMITSISSNLTERIETAKSTYKINSEFDNQSLLSMEMVKEINDTYLAICPFIDKIYRSTTEKEMIENCSECQIIMMRLASNIKQNIDIMNESGLSSIIGYYECIKAYTTMYKQILLNLSNQAISYISSISTLDVKSKSTRMMIIILEFFNLLYISYKSLIIQMDKFLKIFEIMDRNHIEEGDNLCSLMLNL